MNARHRRHVLPPREKHKGLEALDRPLSSSPHLLLTLPSNSTTLHPTKATLKVVQPRTLLRHGVTRALTRAIHPDTVTTDSIAGAFDAALHVVDVVGTVIREMVAAFGCAVGGMEADAWVAIGAAAAVDNGSREERGG
jgi:hypothetical protein